MATERRRVGVSILLVVVGVLFAAVVANVLGPVFFEWVGTPDSLVPAGVAAVMMLGFGGVAALAVSRTGVSVPVERPTRVDVGWTGAALVALALVFVVFVVGLPALGVETPLSRADVDRGTDPVAFLAFAVVGLLFVGPFEELVFRGFLQGALSTVADERAAIVGAAVVFGGFHALAAVDGPLVYVGYATLQGLVLGYVYARTDNLVVAALAHGAFDACINLLSFARL